MRRKINLEGDFEFFSGERIGNILLLGLKPNFMLQVTNLGAKTIFFDYLDRISESGSLKVVVIRGFPGKTGRHEYKEFYTQVIQSILDVSAVYKMFNAVDQLILKIMEMNQIVIHADSGNVLPLFLNISLACDYRIVADNTLFQNPCLEFGLVQLQRPREEIFERGPAFGVHRGSPPVGSDLRARPGHIVVQLDLARPRGVWARSGPSPKCRVVFWRGRERHNSAFVE